VRFSVPAGKEQKTACGVCLDQNVTHSDKKKTLIDSDESVKTSGDTAPVSGAKGYGAGRPARTGSKQNSGEEVPEKKIKPKTSSLKELSGKIGGEHVTENNKVEEPSSPAPEKEPENVNSFTVDDLKTVWENFLGSIEKSNPRLHSILHNHPPQLKSDTLIEISVLGTQLDEIEKEKGSVLKVLRKELKNNKITIDVIIQKQEDVKQKVFTATDKFKVMIDKNPALAEMKKRLGLDLD